MRIPIRRAVISVFDKAGIEELAAALHGVGCEIVSTGSTAEAIRSAGVPATEISEITSFPECLDGRVKTLHPAVHAGILADRRRPEHMRQLAELGVEGFDLVVVNLYPFSRTVASGADYEQCIEKSRKKPVRSPRHCRRAHSRPYFSAAASEQRLAGPGVMPVMKQ